jgi:2-polyprenyl-6-methoxyphenol hydroxylase-like FAD-dependent oxidoreductase
MWPDEKIASDPSTYWTATASKQEMHDYAMQKISCLDPRLIELMRVSSPEDVFKPPLQIRDLVLEAIPTSRITLLGDAAHPMAPFRGRGGVQAMTDALKLADELSKSTKEDVLGHLKVYQDDMLTRASKAVTESRIVVRSFAGAEIWGHECKEAPQAFDD